MRKAQDRYGGPGHWNVYECLTADDSWHYGHLPSSIVRGDASRGEVYGSE